MSITIINDFVLDEIAKDYAKEILDQVEYMEKKDQINDAYDLTYSFAECSDWVIYTDKAHLLCLNCNTDNGQDYVNDCHAGKAMTYNEMASAYAYGELHSRIVSALDDLFEK